MGPKAVDGSIGGHRHHQDDNIWLTDWPKVTVDWEIVFARTTEDDHLVKQQWLQRKSHR